MTTALSSEVIAQLEALLADLRPLLTEYDYNAALHYMDKDAYTLTFEHLCEQLYEYQTPISAALYERLAGLGQLMGYTDESHWQELRPQIGA